MQHERLFRIGAITAIILLSAALVYEIVRPGARNPLPEVVPNAAGMTEQTKINVLYYKVRYLGNETHVYQVGPNGRDDLAELSDDVRMAVLAGARVVSVQGDTVTLEADIHDIGPDNTSRIYVGEHNGLVAVYLGPPTEQKLLYTTDTSTLGLPPEVIEHLRRGIPVVNQTELELTLESLDQ